MIAGTEQDREHSENEKELKRSQKGAKKEPKNRAEKEPKKELRMDL